MSSLHQLAKSAVADLAKQGVRLDAVEDFDHLVNLDRLARAAEDASNDWKSRRTFFPTLGKNNVVLRRLSIGAQWFLDEHVYPNIDPADRNSELACVAFVMAHGGDVAGALQPFCGRPAEFAAAVNAWLRTLSVTWQELDAAVAKLLTAGTETDRLIRRLLYKEDAKRGDGGGTDWPEICGELAAQFGRDPIWWFWEAPDALVFEMLDKLNERTERERQATSRDGVALPNPNSAFIRARRALIAYKAEILEAKTIELRPANA